MAGEFVRDNLLTEGKTKEISSVIDCPDKVIVKNKPKITAHDDPAYTKEFEMKAVYATTTTCKVFEFLNKAGIPTSFIKQLSPTEFLAKKCEMIPLEVIARRLAVGSYLNRHPELSKPEGERPHRFHRLVTEFFLKTKDGKIIGNNAIDLKLPLVEGKEGTKSLEDPLIKDPKLSTWHLYNPKKPAWAEGGELKDSVIDSGFIRGNIDAIDEFNRETFLLLEGAWAILGFLLVDFKIEFGWTTNGQLVISDVIDNDSWRLLDRKFREVSKQVFRDGGSLDEVEINYSHVAKMVSQFRLPKQVIVVWKGSASDKSPESPLVSGVDYIEVILSGHKQTQACLQKLEELQRDYPDGGVIIVPVGMSNGLGPILASHSSWPVIGVPVNVKEFSDDIWSSLRLPSQNPMATILSGKNAVLLALNILAQKNPAAYMVRQKAIEELDTGY